MLKDSLARAPLGKGVALLLLAATAACSSGPKYVVYFQERSAQLDGAANGVVGAAAMQANARPAAPVEVTGYTDSAGSPAADVLLSKQRAQAVADALVAHGVNPARLIHKGEGQTGDDPGLANRRVEIAVDGS